MNWKIQHLLSVASPFGKFSVCALDFYFPPASVSQSSIFIDLSLVWNYWILSTLSFCNLTDMIKLKFFDIWYLLLVRRMIHFQFSLFPFHLVAIGFESQFFLCTLCEKTRLFLWWLVSSLIVYCLNSIKKVLIITSGCYFWDATVFAATFCHSPHVKQKMK